MRFAWLCIAAWCSAHVSLAQEMELPLGNHFRAGCCIPIIVRSNPNEVDLHCDLAVPTRIAGGFSGVVPLLMIGRGQSELAGHPLTALGDDERLVISDESASSLAKKVFPNQQAISIPLDRARASWLSTPLATESVDALAIEIAPDDARVLQWLAEQVTVVCKSRQSATRLPWQPFESGWILRPIGPSKSELLSALDTHPPSWRVERSAEQEKQILLGASLIILLGLLPLVSDRRGCRIASGAILLMGIGAMGAWFSLEQNLRSKAGLIELTEHRSNDRYSSDASVVSGNGTNPAMFLSREDRWRFVGTNRSTPGESLLPPMVDQLNIVKKTGLRLEVNSVGHAVWRFSLSPNQRLAFRDEIVREKTLSVDRSANVTSPLIDLARAAYAEPSSRISLEPGDTDWPTVHVSE